MTDDRPEGTPEPATPPEQQATGSDNTSPAAEPPTAAEPSAAEPSAAEPVTAEPVTAQPVTAEPVTAEPVTAQQPAPTAYAPPPPAAASPAPPRAGGVVIPTWLAILVAILLIGGIGFAIGYATADNGGSNASSAASSQQAPSTEAPRNNPGANVPNPGNFPNGRDAAQTAFLGVAVESAGNNGGARITNVQSGSPAAGAGLKSGDVITKIGDTNIENAADIFRAVRNHSPGDTVTITYTRDGNSVQATVKLGRLSDATRSSVPS